MSLSSAVPQSPSCEFIYAYCHGFLSNSFSIKGMHLKSVFHDRFGLTLHCLDLNGGDMSNLTFKTAFTAIDEVYQNENRKFPHAPRKLRLIGSSFGGQTVASYAAEFPNRVDRLVLLCPGVNIGVAIERLVIQKDSRALEMWKSDGVFPFPLPYTNESILVPFSFLECCQAFPPYPMYSCRAALIHGKDDDVVLLKNIEDFFEKCPEQEKLTELIVVHDDHNLLKPKTLEVIERTIQDLFQLCPLPT